MKKRKQNIRTIVFMGRFFAGPFLCIDPDYGKHFPGLLPVLVYDRFGNAAGPGYVIPGSQKANWNI